MAVTRVGIIPGILGTDLLATLPGGKVIAPWYNPSWIGTYGPDDLELAPDGVSPGPNATAALEPGAPIAGSGYHSLISQLEAKRIEVRWFGYDWRKPLRVSARAVADQIAATWKTGDYVIVCHSMGGLIARLAYPMLWTVPEFSRWKRTVYLGVPHGGSHSATGSLAGFSPGWSPTALYAQVCGFARFVVPGLGQGSANSIRRAREVMATWPGLAALQPQYDAPWTDLDPNASAAYQAANFTADNPAVTQAVLDLAKLDQAALTTSLAAPRPEEVCVYSIGTDTPETFRMPLQLGDNNGYTYTKQGDGAVTADRAILPGRTRVGIKGGHQDYLLSGIVLREILKWEETPVGEISDKIAVPSPPPPATIDGPIAPVPFKPLWPDIQRKFDP
jgi:hypothetical protein